MMDTSAQPGSQLEALAAPFEDPAYWNGDGEGYRGEGYSDFEVNEWKAEYVASLGFRRVLDVGCAFGYLVRRLRDRGVDAWGVDISQYALDQAPAEVKPYLKRGPAHRLPFRTRSFDAVVCFGMLEHLHPDLVRSTFREFARVAKQGVVSITLSTDPNSSNDPSHLALWDYSTWREKLPAGYELWSDAEEVWKMRRAGRYVVVAPTIYPLGKQGYGGIERLVSLFLRGLIERGPVGCVCPRGSVLPRGVTRYETGPAIEDYNEAALIPTFLSTLATAGCFLDFSHSKPVHSHPFLPHLSPIWHDPHLMKPPEPAHNVVALSEWQAARFREVYQQEVRVLDPHCADADYFVPGRGAAEEYGDYVVYLGKLHPTKGAGEAIEACRAAGCRLVIIGTTTGGDPPEYADQVRAQCDGDQFIFHGPAYGFEKLHLFQGAKALLHPVSYPEGSGEAHSHKSIEPPLVGTPVVSYDQGAMREVIDEGVTGFVIRGRSEFADALRQCEMLDREACRERAVDRWDYRRVVDRWLPVMESVARGERW